MCWGSVAQVPMIYPEVLPSTDAAATYSQTLILRLQVGTSANAPLRQSGAPGKAAALQEQTAGMGLTAYAVVEGALPRGLTLTPQGRLSGKPASSGNYRFTVEAEDENGYVSRRAYVLKVGPADRRRGH